jgi:hypothetical protein
MGIIVGLRHNKIIKSPDDLHGVNMPHHKKSKEKMRQREGEYV